MWVCPLCTYRSNDDAADECEICDGPRPAAQAAPPRHHHVIITSSSSASGSPTDETAAAAAPQVPGSCTLPASAGGLQAEVAGQHLQGCDQKQPASGIRLTPASAAAVSVQQRAHKRVFDHEQSAGTSKKSPSGLEEQPLSEKDEAWCAAANKAFLALIQLAVLFHVRRAPLFLRSISDTVSQQNSGKPFDEVTAKAFARISPRQVSLRHEANAQDGQVGTAELRVVVRFEHGDSDGSASDFVPKRARASSLEPSRAGGLPTKSRWRGGSGSWSAKTSSMGMEQLVIAAKAEFARRCQNYARLRRKEGRRLPRLYEGDETQEPSVFAERRDAGTVDPGAGTATGSSWGRGEKVTAVNVLEYLKTTDDYNGQLVHIEPVAARPAQLRDYPTRLAADVKSGLKAAGIKQLFSHQVEGVDAILDGAPAVLATTATSSGKSLMYTIPIAEAYLNWRARSADNAIYGTPEPAPRALLIFPTKALAHDQLGKLRALLAARSASDGTGPVCPGIRVDTLDGDTSYGDRPAIVAGAHVILTNPDMLHVSILPQHKKFAVLLRHLAFVVVDEAHMYRGVFGCHVASVFRRLQRLCAFYGGHPQYIGCSATIANGEEHFGKLIPMNGEGATLASGTDGAGTSRIATAGESRVAYSRRTGRPIVVSQDGSPSGPKLFGIWNPPELDEELQTAWSPSQQPGASVHRVSSYSEAATVLSELVTHGLRTICFVLVRSVAELVLKRTREKLPTQLKNKVAAYRGGYLAERRREIESELSDGRLTAVVATNALELGLDIGQLDATVHVGFPGTMGSLWQQAGRGGRGTRPSVAIFIALDSPLDQALIQNPGKLLQREVEAAIVDPYNLHILKDHLCAAAHELPLQRPTHDTSAEPEFGQCRSLDVELFGKLALTDQVDELMATGELVQRDDGRVGFWSKTTPAKKVSIRNMDGISYKVIDLKRESTHDDGVLETMEYSMAMLKLYEGAVYMHEGRTFVVQQCDTEKHFAKVLRNDVSYYTEPRDHTRVTLLGRTGAREASTSFVVDPWTSAPNPRAGRAPSECVVVVHGRVRVKKEIYGYRKKRASDSQIIDMPDVFMPPLQYDTFGMWISIPVVIRDEVAAAGWTLERGGLHAVEHLLITLCPLLVHTEPNDLKCQCTRRKGDGCAEYIMLFEANKGGIGLAGRIADTAEQLMAAALRRVVGCSCLTGCSSCIHMQNCGDYNEGLEKAAAIYILCRLLGHPCNALPTQSQEADDGTSESLSQPTVSSWNPGVQFPDDNDYMEGWDGQITKVGHRAPESVGRCVICLSRFATPVQTACGHVFCLACVKHHIASSNAAAAGTSNAGPTGGARAATVSAASRGNAYAPGARCPICRMPCAMSDLRPADFTEEDQQDNCANANPQNATKVDAKASGQHVEVAPLSSHHVCESEVDDGWAEAEAAWAAAEADADSSAQ